MSFPIFNRRKPQPEKKGNTITLFGNQKGGVGKSTTWSCMQTTSCR